MGVENEVVYHQQFAFFFTKPVKTRKVSSQGKKKTSFASGLSFKFRWLILHVKIIPLPSALSQVP
jgi:hypothetical protein